MLFRTYIRAEQWENGMKYFVGFQQMGDDGEPVAHESHADYETNGEGIDFIPNVGDYVHVATPGSDEDSQPFSGQVISRLFSYIGTGICAINIVVEKRPPEDFKRLVRE